MTLNPEQLKAMVLLTWSFFDVHQFWLLLCTQENLKGYWDPRSPRLLSPSHFPEEISLCLFHCVPYMVSACLVSAQCDHGNSSVDGCPLVLHACPSFPSLPVTSVGVRLLLLRHEKKPLQVHYSSTRPLYWWSVTNGNLLFFSSAAPKMGLISS